MNADREDMNSFSMMLSLFVFFFLSSCQVKDSAPGGGLISGHKPATNSFSLEAPAAKYYTEGEVITLTYSFPYDIIMDTTSGEPRLLLTIGSNTRYAELVDQPNLKKLKFSYTIQASEEDTNGIDINALELNGSTLQFDNKGTMTNCNVASVKLTNLPNQKVDTIAASISQFNFMSAPGYYREADILVFTITYDEPVEVSGEPYFLANIGGDKKFFYASGSGTNTLTFTYKVTNSDVGPTNGPLTSITSPLVLNGGSIKDTVGNNALLTFDPENARLMTSIIRVIGDSPHVVDITVPENQTYLAGSTLEVVLEFNREVNVTAGTPSIELTIGSNTRQAVYTPIIGLNKKLMTFRYALNPDDVSNGITIKPSITRNGANILNATAPTARNYFISFATFDNNTFIVPDTSGIICNAIQPQAISASRAPDTTIPKWGGTSPDNKWIIGQPLDITVNFNTPIEVTQTNGVPSIDVILDSSTVQAKYHGGTGQSSLIFRYEIKETDTDSGSITLGNINLNGGVLTDGTTNVLAALPTTPITSTIIDGIRPTILSITPPAPKTYSTITGVNNTNMEFKINWSEPVRYSLTTGVKIPMDVGGSATPIPYQTGNNSNIITHRPTVLTALNDSNGVTLTSPLEITGAATITDQAGNSVTNFTFPLPDTSEVLVDTTPPNIQLVEMVTSNGTYKKNDTIDVKVTFSEPVTLTRSGSFPQIDIQVGGVNHVMEALADGEATTHIFRYTINDGDNDNVVVGSQIILGAGTIRDRGLNPTTLTFTAPNAAGIIVDTKGPSTTMATVTPAKAYVKGEKIEIAVTFSEPVYVTGTPVINVDFHLGPDNLSYVSGHGTTTLTFRRSISMSVEHFDMDGLGTVDTIQPGIGTIKDSVGNDANLSFDTIDLTEHYVTYPQVTLWVKNGSGNLAPVATATNIDTTGGNIIINEAMNNIEHIFLNLTTPAVLDNHDFFEGDFKLVNINFGLDIEMALGEFAYDEGDLIQGDSFGTNFAPNTNHFMHAKFPSLKNYSTTNTISSNFDGTLTDIIAVKSGLTNAQIDNLRAYLGF